MQAHKQLLPPGDSVEHVVAEGQAFVLWENFGALRGEVHLYKWKKLVWMLEDLPELPHFADCPLFECLDCRVESLYMLKCTPARP